jgi:hypothetical protein
MVDGLILSWTVGLGQEKEKRRDDNEGVLLQCHLYRLWFVDDVGRRSLMPYKLVSEV